MCVKPRQNPLHDFRPVRTEPLMVGPADHHQLRMLRIGIPEAFHTRERGPAILRSVNEKNGHLAATDCRNTVLGPFHVEAVP